MYAARASAETWLTQCRLALNPTCPTYRAPHRWRAARGRTLKSVIANRKHPGARMTPRGIDPTRRRRAMPSVRQPPADFRKLSSQFQIGHGILRHGSKLERPSVHRRDSQPQAKRESALRKAELAQLRAEFVACHTPGYRAQNGRVKPKFASRCYRPAGIYSWRVFS